MLLLGRIQERTLIIIFIIFIFYFQNKVSSWKYLLPVCAKQPSSTSVCSRKLSKFHCTSRGSYSLSSGWLGSVLSRLITSTDSDEVSKGFRLLLQAFKGFPNYQYTWDRKRRKLVPVNSVYIPLHLQSSNI